MTWLIIFSLIIFALCVWFLARPFKSSAKGGEQTAQALQYGLSRDRLLRQLELLEAQTAEGVVDQAVVVEETQRLELELAGILHKLDASEEAEQSNEDAEQNKLVWWLAVAGFGLVFPVATVLTYGSWQASTLVKLASIDSDMPMAAGSTSSVQKIDQSVVQRGVSNRNFPPEVLAMVAQLENRMQTTPDDGNGWKRLGRAYAVMGRFQESIAAYTKANEFLPDDADVKAALQDLARYKDGETNAPNVAAAPDQHQGQGQFPPQVMQMVAQLEKRLQDSPKDVDGWKRLGRSYMVMKRYSDAVTAYTQAAELAPNDGDIQSALAELASIAGSKNSQHSQAVDKTNEGSISAHPKLPAGSLEEIIALERKVATDQKDVPTWVKLAKAYKGINRTQESIKAFKTAYELVPESTFVLSMYAEAVFTDNPKDPEGKALALYEKLYELNPNHPDGLWFIGLAAYSEGNLSKTVKLWKQLLGVLKPNSEGSRSVQQALSRVEALLSNSKK